MNDGLRSVLIGTAGLSAAALLAVCLTFARGGVKVSESQLRAAVRLVMVAVLAQAAHFAEELATGFHQRFPELLNLTPWGLPFFVGFNVFWLAVWGLSAWALAVRQPAALFPLWFLGVACLANGLAHPSFSLRAGGYFPGLITSPLLAAVGVLLLHRLFLITSDRSPSVGAA